MYGWHPQKREILIGTRFADTVQVHQVAMPGGARTQLTFFPDRVTDASYHPHKGDYFLFRKDVGGGEWYQIFRFDVATGDTTMLTDGKSRNSEFVWSNKGDRIAYASTLRNNADLDFYVIDPATKPEARKPLTENQGGGWQVQRLVSRRPHAAGDRGHLHQRELPVAGGCCHRHQEGADAQRRRKVAYQAIGFSRDGKGIYVTTDKDSEFQRIAYMDIATGVAEVSHQRFVGRGERRALGGSRVAGLRRQRKRPEHAACARSENREAAIGAEASDWPDRYPALAREQSRPCFQPEFGAVAVGRVLGRYAERPSWIAGPTARPAAFRRRISSSPSW